MIQPYPLLSTKSARRAERIRPRDPAPALDHAVQLISRVSELAGPRRMIEQTRRVCAAEGLRQAIRTHDTPALFVWLLDFMSYQGVSNRAAASYIEQHRGVAWWDIATHLDGKPSCPKLKSYWHFHECRYSKSHYTCAEPYHLPGCPLPRYWLRNGRLNQTAFSLYLFIRDHADGDLVSWIDSRLRAADAQGDDPRAALLGPMREIYGVSDKVLAMALASLLLAAPRPFAARWSKVGARMIAVDTLVHNFLHRTGILHRFAAAHAYGRACYQPDGCAEIIEQVADSIDARRFNPTFPRSFPRFVQFAIWRYCAQEHLNICNGNQIDDRQRCANRTCYLYSICDRKKLTIARRSKVIASIVM